MDSSYVEDTLTDAQRAFEREPARKETGLDVVALERLVNQSGYVDLHVAVEGIRLVVSEDGVRVLGIR